MSHTAWTVLPDGAPIPGTPQIASLYATNVAALRALTTAPTENLYYSTLGYWDAGDGGHGEYRWASSSTDADDGFLTLKITAVTTGRFKLISTKKNIRQAGAKGDGVTDDTSSIQTAITGTAGKKLYFNSGEFRVRSTLIMGTNGSVWIGDGKVSTVLIWDPIVDTVFISLTKGAAVLFRPVIKGMRIANVATYVVTGIKASDTSEMLLSDLQLTGFESVVGNVGLQTAGREVATIERVAITADIPIKISVNPNSTISANSFHFEDVFLVAGSTQACVHVDDNVYISQLVFDGFNSWVHGRYGFYWNNTTGTASSFPLIFTNIWREQGDDPAGYAFYVSHTGSGNLTTVKFEGCINQTSQKGWFLRGCSRVSIRDSKHVSATTESINVDATVIDLSFDNFYAEPGSTASLTGQVLVASDLKSASGSPFPSTAIYQSTSGRYTQKYGPLDITTTGLGLTLNGATATDMLKVTDGVTDFRIALNALIRFYTVSNHSLTLGTNNTDRWIVASGGSLFPALDVNYDLGAVSARISSIYSNRHYIGAGAVFWASGTGSPETVVTAPVGSLYSRSDGGAGTSFYVKETGTGNTGWVAK